MQVGLHSRSISSPGARRDLLPQIKARLPSANQMGGGGPASPPPSDQAHGANPASSVAVFFAWGSFCLCFGCRLPSGWGHDFCCFVVPSARCSITPGGMHTPGHVRLRCTLGCRHGLARRPHTRRALFRITAPEIGYEGGGGDIVTGKPRLAALHRDGESGYHLSMVGDRIGLGEVSTTNTA
ncbi:uncharacterized protein LY79DRAFT_551948 [Colletotrichum navitas]|uniref:Uncharacterized protein n=1 Tax=Colletotrichum navitas TaxID=681940 RepID=A0AAD8V415_9PEZI|nr:uncharacterized protein LY79DRAFT_551948 [Colletotrichum navitas]KAK1593477.1 hypothetical protein LY79DRAFT_551948 [Colletotrichum navitas]